LFASVQVLVAASVFHWQFAANARGGFAKSASVIAMNSHPLRIKIGRR
jgi:hypothetical protein